ncbi:unnamed protein product [Caenorhabditis sp. 36 PRJEB53466]|nr:unnamed protein product [Caenorhabditis sp. 36 PRJEB53466]
MKVCQLKSAMTVVQVLFALLSLPPTLLADLTSVYVPVAVGEPQDGRNFDKPFGVFGAYSHPNIDFSKCGKHTHELNEQFAGNSAEIHVYCEPTPTRLVVRVNGNADFGSFQRDLKKECELFTCSAESYVDEKTVLGTYTGTNGGDVLAGAKPNENVNVCKDKLAGYSNGATGNILFANEANCFETYPDERKKVVTGKEIAQVPRWLKAGQDRLNIRSFFYDGQKMPYVSPVPYYFVPRTSKDNLVFKTCKTACDSGEIVKFTMNTGAYKMLVYLKNSCHSFKVCIDPTDHSIAERIPVCKPGKSIDVLVTNGVVVWPNQGRASLIELKSAYHEDAYAVPIEFGYGINEADATNPAPEYYVANDHREFVTSDSNGFNADEATKLAFFFPKPDCLAEKAGIFSKNINNGESLVDSAAAVTDGNVYDGEKSQVITKPQEEVVTTTTVEPIKDIPQTTTAAPRRVVPSGARLADGEQAAETNAMSAATYVTGKWWVWGIYIGFVIGTLVTLGLGAGIFYLMRRTVFGVWYRGMYKRYGCDASGTTGGLTGVGFGNTMTGDVTVQGTTGGGTTAGATTGGTSVMEKSQATGTSTLAM